MKSLVIALAALTLASATGCSHHNHHAAGPVERAGRKVDEKAHDVKETAKDVKDDVKHDIGHRD